MQLNLIPLLQLISFNRRHKISSAVSKNNAFHAEPNLNAEVLLMN